MNESREQELKGIARKIKDTPQVLEEVIEALDQVVVKLGFKLSDEELYEVLRLLFYEDPTEGFRVFAGAGAQCCSQRCQKPGDLA